MGKTMSDGNVSARRPLLNRRQVAELLNICERTVARMEAAGRLPAIRIGDQTANYVAQGKLPPPRKLGAKRMWKWKEVGEWLANGAPNDRIGSACLPGLSLQPSRYCCTSAGRISSNDMAPSKFGRQAKS